MVDYTQNQNGLFNNNSTSQLTGNTSGTNNSSYTQNTSLPGNFTAGLTQNFNAGTNALAGLGNVGRWGGSLVAPMNGQQIQASGNFSALSGYQPMMVNPGNVTAYTSGTGPGGLGLNGANLSGYMNPYTSQVINTSLDQINRQLAQANQATAGNAALSGAFGGDRAAIMQSENTRNANDLAAQTIANLNNQNFAQAQAQANTDIGRQLQAGTTQAQLGLSAGQGNQLAGLQGANLQLGATNALANLGQTLRNTDTQGVQAAYQDWVRSQSVPLQVAQMQLQAGLSGLPYLAQHSGTTVGTQNTTQNTNQTGTQSGTSSSTMTGTGPQPSTLSQVVGGIGTAAGLGGLLFGGGSGSGAGGLIGGLGSLYNNTLGSNGLNLFGTSGDAGGQILDPSSPLSYTPYLGGDGYIDSGSFNDFSTDPGGDFGFARGGLIGYANGGDVDDDSFLSAYDDDYSPRQAAPGWMANISPGVSFPNDPSYDDMQAVVAPQPGDVPDEDLPSPPIPPANIPSSAPPASARPGIPASSAPIQLPASPAPMANPTPAAAGLAALQSRPSDPQNPYMKDDFIGRLSTGTGGNSWALPVLAAGLATLAGKSPHAGANIGQGALAGVQMLQQMGANRTAAAQRWEQMRMNDAYRQSLLGVKQRQADTQQQRADTYSQSAQDRANYHQSQIDVAKAKAERAIAGGTSRDQAYRAAAQELRDQGVSESDIYRELSGLNIRQQNAENASKRNELSADRQQSLDNDRDRRAQQSANSNEDNAARSLIHAASMNGQVMGYADALAQVRSGRSTLGPAAVPGGSAADPISAARAAIARGAPRDAVLARLRQNGISPPADF